MTRLRTVLVGFGRAAAGYAADPLTARHFRYISHAQVLAEHPSFAWEAVIDPDPAARSAAREQWGIKFTAAGAQELDRACQPEIAVVAAPPDQRAGVLEAWPSLQAVVVEKPLGPTLADAQSWAARAARCALVVQVNYWRRADEAMRRLADGQLEELVGCPQAAFGVYGNGLLNNGSHLVDLMRMLFGEIDDARATGAARAAGPLAGDVDVPFRARWAGGLAAFVAPLDFCHYREMGLDIWGERGRLAIVNEGLSVLFYPRQPHRAMQREQEISDERSRTLEPTAGRALYRLYDNLAAALERGAPLWSSPDSALRTAEIIQRIRDSA